MVCSNGSLNAAGSLEGTESSKPETLKRFGMPSSPCYVTAMLQLPTACVWGLLPVNTVRGSSSGFQNSRFPPDNESKTPSSPIVPHAAVGVGNAIETLLEITPAVALRSVVSKLIDCRT